MRIGHLLLLPLVLVALIAPGTLRADEASDALTATLPKDADVCVRLPALDRIDGLAKDMALVLELLGGDEAKKMLAQGAPSEMMLGMLGIDGTLVDRTKPIYVSAVGNDPLVMIPAAAGATLAEPLPLQEGHLLVLKNGMLHASRQAVLDAEPRGTPAKLLAGDFAAHVFVADMTERHRAEIEGGLAQMGGMMGMMMPGGAAVGDAVVSLVKGAIFSVDSVDYALTWQGEGALAEGRVDMKADSAFRKLLARAGAPQDVGLSAVLPRDALIVMDFATTPDWPAKEMFEFSGTLGPQIAGLVQQSMALNQAMADAITGRQAMSFGMQGFMGMSIVTVGELKEGVDAAKILAEFDPTAMNESFKKNGIPIAFKLDKNVAKHGETDMHRWTMQSDDPQLGMMAMMMQTYIAVEGGHFCVVAAPTAETDMRDLLDRIREGGNMQHPHMVAMAQLGRSRNMGVTFNAGQLKSLGMMLGAFAPEAAQALAALPDNLSISTAVSFTDGNIHWRGNWPLKQIGEVVEKIRASMGGGDAEDAPREGCGEMPDPEEEEDFE